MRPWREAAPGARRWRSATALRVQPPGEALAAVSLGDADELVWRPRPDLLASDRFAAEFVVEEENEGRVTLRFGDDVHGRIPSAGVPMVARYRVGGGPAGNVGAGALAHVVTTPGLGIDASDPDHPALWNPVPAVGGVLPESMEEVRQYAPQAFRVQERAVTEADYAAVARRHPEVSRAVARRLWTGSWHTIFLTVDRVGGRPVDPPSSGSWWTSWGASSWRGTTWRSSPPASSPWTSP
jgi:predicted phage baseplate assembly protein